MSPRLAEVKFKELTKQYKQPLTAHEAEQFLQALKAAAFDNPEHLKLGPKRNLGLAQGPRADEQQPDGLSKKDSQARGAALIGQALQKKFDLNSRIVQSEAEAARAGGTMDVLFGLGRYLAWYTGATFIPGPPKGWDGVIRKTMDFKTELNEKSDGRENVFKQEKNGQPMKDRNGTAIKNEQGYEGNYSKMKDEVRMTLVCKNLTMQDLVTKMAVDLVSMGRMYFVKPLKPTLAESDPCGYSGVNGAIRTRTGEHGELQINVPTVMFGKMSGKDYRSCMGISDSDYTSLEQRYGLTGGYGHVLYEVWRDNRGNPKGDKAAELSKRYYALLRAFPKVDAQKNRALIGELDAFRGWEGVRPYFDHKESERKSDYQSDYR